jgi:pimeloyl-ACP methyl ester carboxylesterase
VTTREGGGDAGPLLVIIPGNPGVAALYGALVGALEAHGHEVLVASHPPLRDAADLLPYARHHAEATRRHLDGAARPVVLIGHSVGAYLGYLIVARDLLPVSRLILLCPFVARPRLSGRLILALVTCAPLFAAGMAALRVLPGSWRRGLLRRAGAGDLTSTIAELLCSALPATAAAMARAERAEIAIRPHAGYLFEHPLLADPARTAALLAPDDRWVSAAVQAQLGVLAPPPDRRLGHALVVDGEQCRLVAAALHGLLRSAAGVPLVSGPL